MKSSEINMKLLLEKAICNLEFAGCVTLGKWKYVAHFGLCHGLPTTAVVMMPLERTVLSSWNQLQAEGHH